MEGNYITRQEHDEFARRIEAEGKRRDDENKRQNSRIDEIEKEPAKDYKQIKMAIITAIIGTVVGIVIGAVVALL